MSDFDKASRLSTKDLLIEDKLNKIANNAVPKRAKSPKIKFRKSRNIPVVQSTGFIPEMALRDIILDAQVNRISNGAIEDTKGQTANTIKSPVTEQMIEEMQLEQQSALTQPVLVGGIEYKYNPLTMPPPTLENPVLIALYPDNEIDDMVQAKGMLTRQIDTIVQEIQGIDEELERIRVMFDIENGKYEKEKGELRKLKKTQLKAKLKIKSSSGMTTEELIERILMNHPGNPVIYEYEKDRLIRERDQFDYEIKQHEGALETIDRNLDIQEQNIRDNRAIQLQTERDNKAKLDLYAQELNSANRGKLNVGQNINESDADYLQRLIDIGQTVADPDQVLDSAILINSLRAKKNLEQVITNKGTVETIVKMLSPDERFLMNKQFERVKKAILETYGKDNKSVTESDVVDIIQFVVSSAPIVGQRLGPDEVEAPRTPIARIEPIRPGTTIRRRSPNTVPSNLTKIEIVRAIMEYNNAHQDQIQYLDTETVQSLYEKLVNVGISERAQIKRLADLASVGTASALPTAPVTPIQQRQLRAPLTGFGFHNYPKLVPFGKIMISPDKLYYRNILQVRTNKGKQLTGISNMRVSETLVSIIMKALEGHRVNKSELNLLSTKERHVYDNLMYMSGGHKHHETTLDKTTHEMKERLDLIEGELDAGNNNPMLIKELHALLHRMARTGLITMNNAAKHYKELKDYYSLKPQK